MIPLLALAFVLGLQAPSTAAAPPKPSTGLLGFSTTTLNGSHGQLTMNSACVDTFGAGAFMCPTTAFAMQPIPPGVTGEGWVQTVLAPVASQASTLESSILFEVATGMQITQTFPLRQVFSCNGWTMGGAGGLSLQIVDAPTSFAGFHQGSCAVQQPVACCRLP
jgi:hypothetical protein